MSNLAQAARLPALTASQMREADRITIEDFGIPGHTLMESASRAAAQVVTEHYGPMVGKRVVCFCGKGNNGGDGLVVARVLYTQGAHVTVVTLAEPAVMTRDAALNFRLLERLQAHDANQRLIRVPYEGPSTLQRVQQADLFVDALLGTGLDKPLRDPIASIVAWLNDQRQPTIAIDIPTGLHADTGAILGAAVQAEATVTMAALKAGLLLGEGLLHAGEVQTVDIGIPPFAMTQAQGANPTFVTTDVLVQAALPKRGHDAHKFSVGMGLMVGGSSDYIGAPFMASMAMARSGAGYVVCACPDAIRSVLATKLVEIPVLGLSTIAAGTLAPEAALHDLGPRLEKATALLVGCGLGRAPETQTFVRKLLTTIQLPIVVDADGLNALVNHAGLISQHANGQWILTPHAGEFRRLVGEDIELTDRVAVARVYAQRWNSVLILKGLPSLVACPDGTVYINATGNAALATAGTGDILAGLCAGLLAQGLSASDAAVCALHIGGAAADRYVATKGKTTLLATDLLSELPLVMSERFTA